MQTTSNIIETQRTQRRGKENGTTESIHEIQTINTSDSPTLLSGKFGERKFGEKPAGFHGVLLLVLADNLIQFLKSKDLAVADSEPWEIFVHVATTQTN